MIYVRELKERSLEKMLRNRLGGCQSVVAEEMEVVWTSRWETTELLSDLLVITLLFLFNFFFFF